ncbi:uncharacterized protein FOMMEDRAFT_150441 [Fomitiporia mediterranea MF3/22]|uniref:uncharacterized protein n=1 Tax=Fomitiporia mediterranea (strain MF3/22) TaxID=694068 RepID=UPI0004408019|nr:uncharacterized protein FOMMEDRAFT_150441 [Fomitiporia mediterranea MF3/22]EJD07858.1 hypothetical protein FOMMEDRAFT_150441 [Fomitiporia mediterranea MF3/22]
MRRERRWKVRRMAGSGQWTVAVSLSPAPLGSSNPPAEALKAQKHAQHTLPLVTHHDHLHVLSQAQGGLKTPTQPILVHPIRVSAITPHIHTRLSLSLFSSHRLRRIDHLFTGLAMQMQCKSATSATQQLGAYRQPLNRLLPFRVGAHQRPTRHRWGSPLVRTRRIDLTTADRFSSVQDGFSWGI